MHISVQTNSQIFHLSRQPLLPFTLLLFKFKNLPGFATSLNLAASTLILHREILDIGPRPRSGKIMAEDLIPSVQLHNLPVSL
jgi:hypothetical protein